MCVLKSFSRLEVRANIIKRITVKRFSQTCDAIQLFARLASCHTVCSSMKRFLKVSSTTNYRLQEVDGGNIWLKLINNPVY